MLNRTNRTLSANTNRLNLGTRKLDQNASANIGTMTLRTASRFSLVSVRPGITEYPGISVEAPPIPAEPKRMKPEMLPMSGSSLRPSSPVQGFWTWDQGSSVTDLSQPDQLFAVLRDVVETRRGVIPQVPTSHRHTRSSLAWHCDRSRRAGRSALAALALVTGAASIT